jgi:hypothetical protein
MGKRARRVMMRTEDTDMQKHTIIGSVLLTLGIVAAIAMLPDIVRYMKIRSM